MSTITGNLATPVVVSSSPIKSKIRAVGSAIGEGIAQGIGAYAYAYFAKLITVEKGQIFSQGLPFLIGGIAVEVLGLLGKAIIKKTYGFLRKDGRKELNEKSIYRIIRIKISQGLLFVEKMAHKVDALFSKMINIRSLKTLKEDKIALIDYSAMEIIRKAFLEQAKETIKQLTSQRVTFSALSLIGYSAYFAVASHVFLSTLALQTVVGFVGKITDIYTKIREEKENLKKEKV